MIKTTLVSQLFYSINQHLKIIYQPIEDYQMSIENSVVVDDDNDNDSELWLSGHRSIFSSYGSHCQKTIPSIHTSQYEGYSWNLYKNSNYHQLAFEQKQRETNLSDWSMNIDESSSPPSRTSWHEIRKKSLSNSSTSSTTTNTSSNSGHYSPNPLTLYSLFQRTKSQQHPCRLYDNFSDKSICDSLTTSSSSSSLSDSKTPPIKSRVDQCLQTSTIEPLVNHSTSTDEHLSSNPSQSLPDLDFLTYYAKENPIPLSKHTRTVMKSPLIDPFSLKKNNTRTIFYCTIKIPSDRPTTLYPSRPIKRIKTNSTEDHETISSVCSSTSSSGYCSNSSRHIQTPSSPYPLKSCLKRTKIDELSTRLNDSSEEISKHRRYSAPTSSSSHEKKSSYPIKTKTCTLSEHDLRAKKSVSFCNEIARRLITPSTSPKDRYDLLPRENLTDSPPNEFNLSDDDDDNNNNDVRLINFIENVPEDIPKPLPLKYGNDKNFIDAFANTILHIFEIKCSDPKAYYLNNQINHELDRILRHELCLLIREILEDGLKQNSNFLFTKKMNLWRLIELTTPTIGPFHEAKTRAQIGLSKTVEWIELFNSFIYQLLNLHELASWLSYFISQRILLKTYYESWAFIIVNNNNDLLENLTNQLEKLSPLSFRLKYTISLINQNSLISKKFHVRTWLRDRKTQVKISPKESSTIPPNVTIRRKFSSIPIVKQ